MTNTVCGVLRHLLVCATRCDSFSARDGLDLHVTIAISLPQF